MDQVLRLEPPELFVPSSFPPNTHPAHVLGLHCSFSAAPEAQSVGSVFTLDAMVHIIVDVFPSFPFRLLARAVCVTSAELTTLVWSPPYQPQSQGVGF